MQEYLERHRESLSVWWHVAHKIAGTFLIVVTYALIFVVIFTAFYKMPLGVQ